MSVSWQVVDPLERKARVTCECVTARECVAARVTSECVTQRSTYVALLILLNDSPPKETSSQARAKCAERHRKAARTLATTSCDAMSPERSNTQNTQRLRQKQHTKHTTFRLHVVSASIYISLWGLSFYLYIPIECGRCCHNCYRSRSNGSRSNGSRSSGLLPLLLPIPGHLPYLLHYSLQ